MDKLQFGRFTFPHNPQKLTISYSSRLLRHYLPYSGERSQKLCPRLREVRCSGVFFSDDPATSAAQLEGLLTTASGENSGLLLIPGVSPFFAFLKDCAIDFLEDGRIIPYTLLFVEEGEPSVLN